jgi:hypothetical protein
MKQRIAAIVIYVLFILQGCSNKQYNNNFNDPILFSRTVKELNNVVMQNGFPPIIASRNYAYACVLMKRWCWEIIVFKHWPVK